MTAITTGPHNPQEAPNIRVMIVDDSAVIRAVITRTLTPEQGIEVVGTAPNGDLAVKAIARLQPDIVVLDIEMPVMDGLTALPLLLKEKPDVRVLICSTLSARGADVTMKALALGATDSILKPGGESISSAADFQRDLVRVIRVLGRPRKKYAPTNRTNGADATAGTAKKLYPQATITLRPHKAPLPPKILAIGSSTGGPKALMDMLKGLKNFPLPIVITQHMPKTFTAMLAQHIEQNCGIPCFEGAEGMVLKPGSAYVAPGGLHMIFQKGPGEYPAIHLDSGPPENFCRPSVDVMLRSLVDIYGSRILTVILTGMGSDGLEGCRKVVDNGGNVIAQDEETSIVWGMPGAVATAGLCSAVQPLSQLDVTIKKLVTGS